MKILDKSFDITKACSKDDFRPAMKHVYIDVERKQAVTCNSIKLMVQPIEFDENDVLDWGHQQDGKNISRQILPKQQHSISEMIEFCEEQIKNAYEDAELNFNISTEDLDPWVDYMNEIIVTLRGLKEEVSNDSNE